MSRSQGVVLCGVMLMTTSLAHAADESRGKALYENHCVSCHDDTVHKREKHKAASYADIEKYVARWEKELKLTWTAEDRRAVAQYVNDTYYKF